MPVPTDTLWNIKRLNKVFALSAVLMTGTFIWAVAQDYDKEWRRVQQRSKLWQAAVVEEKIERTQREVNRKRLEQLNDQIAALQEKYGVPGTADSPPKPGADRQHEADKQQIKKLSGQIENLSVSLNN